jgi:V8-like Glu-specific endopeptidase
MAEGLEKDCKATVSGFEATVIDNLDQNTKRLSLYSHSGPIEKVEERAIYYNIDTKEMQSGSPVFLKKDGRFGVVGVHKGYGGKTKHLNVATRVTTAMVKQIEGWAKEMSIVYENKTSMPSEIEKLARSQKENE